MSYFPTADDSRTAATNNLTLYNEISALEKAILTATKAGKFTTTVSNTYMATNSDYFNALDADTTNEFYNQMNTVSNYFINLGYTISRTANTSTFSWVINW